MFTGLVEAVGEVVGRTASPGGVQLSVAASLAGELSPGDSVAVNGVCLTVVRASGGTIVADVGPETLAVTTLGTLATGRLVNLERPLRADGRFGGHFVQGHVDAVGTVEALQAEAEFHWLTVAFPARLAPFIVHRGSIAIDGISLTAARLGVDRLDVQVVPYTMAHTNLGGVRLHDPVNLECDMIGKYVARATQVAGLAPAER
jgi:riboflavin synthase